MCLKHTEFRAQLSSENFSDIVAVIIDEAHRISQWGGQFRPTYAELEKLRAFFPHIPFLATSATLSPSVLLEVRMKLRIDTETSFHINLGNDCPNIAASVVNMEHSMDYDSLLPFLKPDAESPEDLPKTIIFTNAVNTTQFISRHVRKQFTRRF